MKMMLALLALSLSLVCPGASADSGVGIRDIEMKGDYAVPLKLWYPSTAPSETRQAGPYTVHATRDAPIAPGRHALILLSHGSGGGEFGHADLAVALAQHGYIVATPRHLGDSYDHPEGRGSDVQLFGRPWQAKAALDAVLAAPDFKDAIDPARIGMAGFSAGAYTTLVMAGAKPDFALHLAYCKAHPDDGDLCPDGADSRLRITRPGWQVPDDHRVRAAVVMAPLSVAFDANAVKGVTIPIRLYKAETTRSCAIHGTPTTCWHCCRPRQNTAYYPAGTMSSSTPAATRCARTRPTSGARCRLAMRTASPTCPSSSSPRSPRTA